MVDKDPDFTQVSYDTLNKNPIKALRQYKNYCSQIPEPGQKDAEEEKRARILLLNIVDQGNLLSPPILNDLNRTKLFDYWHYLIDQESNARHCYQFREAYRDRYIIFDHKNPDKLLLYSTEQTRLSHQIEIDLIKSYHRIIETEISRLETYMKEKAKEKEKEAEAVEGEEEKEEEKKKRNQRKKKKKRHQWKKKKRNQQEKKKSIISNREKEDDLYLELANKIKIYENERNKARVKYISIMWSLILNLLALRRFDNQKTKWAQSWERLQKFLNVDDEEIILQVIHLFTFILFGTNLENVSAEDFNMYSEHDLIYIFSKPRAEESWETQQIEMGGQSLDRWIVYLKFFLELIGGLSIEKEEITRPIACEDLDEKECNTHIKNCQWKDLWDIRIAVSDYSPVKGCSSRFGCKDLNEIECNKLTNKNCRWKDDRNECWNFEPRRELAKNSDLIGLKISWGEGGKSGKLFGDERVFHFKFPFADDFRRWQKSSPEIFLNGIVVDKTRKIGELLTYFIFWITDGKKLYLPSKDKNKKEWAFKKKDKFLNKNVQIKDQLVNNDHIYLALRKKK